MIRFRLLNSLTFHFMLKYPFNEACKTRSSVLFTGLLGASAKISHKPVPLSWTWSLTVCRLDLYCFFSSFYFGFANLSVDSNYFIAPPFIMINFDFYCSTFFSFMRTWALSWDLSLNGDLANFGIFGVPSSSEEWTGNLFSWIISWRVLSGLGHMCRFEKLAAYGA